MTIRPRVTVVSVLALLLWGAGVLQARLESAKPIDTLEGAELYVRSVKALDRMALSYDALLADVYWIRAIQHFGGVRRSADEVKRYDLLYPLLDLTTGLDPYFSAVYIFGPLFLAEPQPGGAGRPDLGIVLLERALRYQPDVWRFAQHAGFIHYWYRQDYAEAAAWFGRAAQMPGAPPWLVALEASSRADGGDLDGSRRIWRQLMETADSDFVRETAQFRLTQIETFAAVDALTDVVTQFSRANGRPPAGWHELVRAGRLAGIPLDPTGVPFLLDHSGNVTVSPQSRMHPLPKRPVPRVS